LFVGVISKSAQPSEMTEGLSMRRRKGWRQALLRVLSRAPDACEQPYRRPMWHLRGTPRRSLGRAQSSPQLYRHSIVTFGAFPLRPRVSPVITLGLHHTRKRPKNSPRLIDCLEAREFFCRMGFEKSPSAAAREGEAWHKNLMTHLHQAEFWTAPPCSLAG